ncbi:MAG: enoyl-CoA hydratase-related protein [Bacteroidota bacterium]
MKLYTSEQCAQFEDQSFAFIQVEIEDRVMILTLDRERKKNALHPQMVNEIAYAFNVAFHREDVWMLLIQAKGKVFCSGADLKAFAGMVEPNDSSVPQPAEEILIGQLFRDLRKPIICKVAGNVYAGGFLFLAGAHIVLAQDDIKLGLPEVKRGLFPFQVMASLLQVMPARKVMDWCIRGYNLPVRDAERYGLVSESYPADQLEARTQEIIHELRQNSPKAISMGLEAYDHIRPSEGEHQYLLNMFRQTIMSADGQEGIKAFREKRSPVWTGK